MTETTNSQTPTDPVIETLQQFHAGMGYKNDFSTYRRGGPKSVGQRYIYPIVFKGERDRWYTNYVCEKGGRRSAYSDVIQMLDDKNIGLILSETRTDLLKIIVVSILTMFFAIAVVYITIFDPDNKALSILNGLLLLTIGYFVGKSESTK
jgi:hypothetical protein